jgi:hypothetical protein
MQSTQSTRSTRSARVSLFEVGVILCILALLTAVLSPLAAKASDQRGAARYMPTQHALQYALALYAADYEAGLLPQCSVDGGNFVSTEGGCKDTATGRVWSTGYTDNTGIHNEQPALVSYCSNLTEGGKSDWRLPSQNELVKVAADGAGAHLNVTDIGAYNWSSDTKGPWGFAVRLDTGAVFKTPKTSNFDGVCVR